ncbi:hypothetical protein TVAG_189580 [Trichomonas vaginalis G3]|uniref:Uncharacterized protein n=1 Tax=Trichomonas vaginalis (strain ATCC PRA-98 / G3) TaxID=412133 RepID=A2F1R2_TRIV3|nr:hypothetical protein TVAGG3_0149850 [Trichomonas vaginalis G3]EAY01172.1 hypothetical protein TVAG_189580 [Trichomonas vaginalis G3]KAI5547199.1 hypothetical protein TVAGG3_0149850 [Trichomonas vaginalis G3]|eukprot:XP_001330119.1 hypothetical protein [Trichomonas vaginalis G3]
MLRLSSNSSDYPQTTPQTPQSNPQTPPQTTPQTTSRSNPQIILKFLRLSSDYSSNSSV